MNTAQGNGFKVRAQVGLGKAYYFVDRWFDAVHTLRQAAEWARQNFQALEAEAFFYLGELAKRGDGRLGGNAPAPDVALRYYEAAIQGAHQSNNLDVFFKSILADARMYRDRGHVCQVMGRYEAVLARATAPAHIQYLRQAQCAVGTIYFEQNFYGRAKSFFEHIQPYGEEDFIYGQACLKLVQIAIHEGKKEEARRYRRAALRCEHVPEFIKALLRGDAYRTSPGTSPVEEVHGHESHTA